MLKLVYGCLAFSAVALGLLIFAASRDERGFHGTTNPMLFSLQGEATVIAADANGAVTETGNGRVAGYDRSGRRLWSTKFDRFAPGPNNPYGSGVLNATGWCAGACPSAIVHFSGVYHGFGGTSSGLANAITTLKQRPADLLAVAARDQAWVRAPIEGRTQKGLFALTGDRAQSIPVVDPVVVTVSGDDAKALVATSSSGVGSLQRFVRVAGRWRASGARISDPRLQNACFSVNGDWIGAVSDRIRIYDSTGREHAAAGQVVSGGTCTIDAAGLTVVTNPAGAPSTLRLTRYNLAAEPVWSRSLGAQRLLSHGNSKLVVAVSGDQKLTAYDVLSGKPVAQQTAPPDPYVGADGSVVTATRNGRPTWLAAPQQR